MNKKEKLKIRKKNQRIALKARRLQMLIEYGVSNAALDILKRDNPDARRYANFLGGVANSKDHTELRDNQIALIQRLFKGAGYHLSRRNGKVHLNDKGVSLKESKNTGSIYLIREKGTTFVKIGYGRSLNGRKRSLQTGNPRQLIISDSVDVTSWNKRTKQIEAMIHKKLKAFKVRGEWFDIASDKKILDVIAEVKLKIDNAQLRKAEKEIQISLDI